MLKARSPLRALAKHRAFPPPPPAPQGRLFPARPGNALSSYCALRGGLLHGPVELGPVDPHAVQNDRELASDSDLGLAEPVALGESYPTSGSNCEAESTDAPERGGLPRSSDEASVMLVERRGQAIAICSGQPVSGQPTTGGTRCRMEGGTLHAVARAG